MEATSLSSWNQTNETLVSSDISRASRKQYTFSVEDENALTTPTGSLSSMLPAMTRRSTVKPDLFSSADSDGINIVRL